MGAIRLALRNLGARPWGQLWPQGQLWLRIIDGGQTPDKQKFFVVQRYRHMATLGMAFAP
jgi:hypothetical protein